MIRVAQSGTTLSSAFHHPLCLHRADGGFLWQQPLHDDDHDRSPQWEANSHLAQRRPQTPKATNANENTKTTNRPTNSRNAEAKVCDHYRPPLRQTVTKHTKAIQLVTTADHSAASGKHDNRWRSDYDQPCSQGDDQPSRVTQERSTRTA